MTTTNAWPRRAGEPLIFGGIAILLAGYVLLGFWKSYFAVGALLATLPSAIVHLHAILFVGWMALFATQTALVGTGRVAVHRRLGAVMGGWALAMILAGPVTAVMAVRRPGSGVGAGGLAGDLAQTLAFAVLIASGFAQRRTAPAHKRFMTLATAAIVGPALVRWPFDFVQQGPPVAVFVFYLAAPLLLIAYDLRRLGHVHRATWLGFGLMAMVLVCFVGLPAWQGWQTFTSWIRGF